jgi:hypothetical protein
LINSKISVEKGLKKKGFRKMEDSDHSYFIYYTDLGKKTTILTKTSHGSTHKDISKPIFGCMAKQCKLSTNDFSDLIECRLSQSGYEQILKSLHFI